MSDDTSPKIPGKMPMKVGESDQYLRGIVFINKPRIHVRITVEDLNSDQTWTDDGMAPAPFTSFCEALQQWQGSITYPSDPKGGTKTIKPEILESYWLRYRQAYELMVEDNALAEYLQQLWMEYKKDQNIQPHYDHKTRKVDRENFKNALKTRLKNWKKSKNK